jgi:hypothetical protein
MNEKKCFEYMPINSAPKDGTILKLMTNTSNSFQLYRGYFKKGKWLGFPFKNEENPTHWKPNDWKPNK